MGAEVSNEARLLLGITLNNPKPGEKLPQALNMCISFEEAMRLHLGLGQALAKLNSYNRATKEGKHSAVNLCLYIDGKRITINEGKVNA